ncbi:hypothetical protein HY546_02760 [archaeon]|nr:hypothetical protein [archaeon]
MRALWLFALLLTGSVLAHGGIKQPITTLQQLAIIDGNIGSDWNDSTSFTFGNGSVQAYIKGNASSRLLQLAFRVYTPNDSSVAEFCTSDFVNLRIDWNHGGTTSPDSDDVSYSVGRPCGGSQGNVQELHWSTTLNRWVQIPSPYSWNTSSSSTQNAWQVEFSIPIPASVPMPQALGAFIEAYDHTPVGSYRHTWLVTSQTNSPSSWGDFGWPGTARASDGGGLEDHLWWYDPDSPDSVNELLHLVVDVTGEAFKVEYVTLRLGGTAQPADISRIVLVHDVNVNNNYDSGDTLFGSGSFPQGDGGGGVLVINVTNGGTVLANSGAHFLVGAEMSPSAVIGRNVSVSATALFVTGQTSGFGVNALDQPVWSVVKTIRESVIKGGKGPNSPADHSYTSGVDSRQNVMLQLKIRASSASVMRFEHLNITAYGSGDDTAGVSRVLLVRDLNANGLYDSGEPLDASGSYGTNDGNLTLAPPAPIVAYQNDALYLLAVYEMTDNVSIGDTFAFKVSGLRVAYEGNSSLASFSLPIISATKTIVTDKNATCKGNVQLGLLPDLAGPNLPVQANVSGLVGCGNFTAYLRAGTCSSGALVSSCLIGPAGECSATFNAPSSEGNYTYVACVDKDRNRNISGDERDSETLQVSTTGGPCSGSLIAEISKPEEKTGEAVEISAGGLSACDGKAVSVKLTTCSGASVAACVLTDTGCVASFSAPAEAGDYRLAVCFDKNNDKVFGLGESVSISLKVSERTRDLTLLLLAVVVMVSIIGIVAVVERLIREKPRQ